MKTYKANHSFLDDRLGKVKRDQEIQLEESAAASFVRAGLLREIVTAQDTTENPTLAVGTQPSALPAAPALAEKIVKKSGRGRKPKADAPSSL